MREILFKGKTVSGEWIEGDLLNYLGYGKVHIAQNYKGAGGREVIPESVSEFIGLYDKKGKKVFEGDIIKGSWNTVFVVYWDDCYLQFRARKSDGHEREIDYYGESKDLEVIGNVHDNPELLTEN